MTEDEARIRLEKSPLKQFEEKLNSPAAGRSSLLRDDLRRRVTSYPKGCVCINPNYKFETNVGVAGYDEFPLIATDVYCICGAAAKIELIRD